MWAVMAAAADYQPSGSDLHSSPADANCHARPRNYQVVPNNDVSCYYYR